MDGGEIVKDIVISDKFTEELENYGAYVQMSEPCPYLKGYTNVQKIQEIYLISGEGVRDIGFLTAKDFLEAILNVESAQVLLDGESKYN